MAKAEFVLTGNFFSIVKKIEDAVVEGSISASLEEKSDYWYDSAKCSVRVFERYSYSGGNRVSLTVTLFQPDGEKTYISAITTGGSQAMFFKLNTFGEEAFLDKFRQIIDSISE